MRPMTHPPTMRQLLAIGLASLLTTFGSPPTPAAADEITVKGTTLRGTVTGVTGKAIEFQWEYSDASMPIPYENIDTIVTDTTFYVLHDQEGETTGRILGIVDGLLLLGDDPETAARIDMNNIVRAQTTAMHEASLLERTRSRLRFWNGTLDLGAGVTKATTDTTTMAAAFRAERKKSPTRLVLGSSYRRGDQKERDAERSTLENELRGSLRGELDLSERFLTFGAADAEYDEVERLSIRGDPRAGIGYRLYTSDAVNLQVESGFGYVYQRFFGGDIDDYPTNIYGAEATLQLPYDALFRWRADYQPSLSDWLGRYRIRSEASLAIPIIRFLAFKFAVLDEYNNRPAADADRNTLATTLGLSVSY